MTDTVERALAAVQRYLREHFPDARLQRRRGADGSHAVEVITGVRRYRLFLAADLVQTRTASAIEARCRADNVAWRLADATRLLVTRRETRRPPPGDDG